MKTLFNFSMNRADLREVLEGVIFVAACVVILWGFCLLDSLTA